MSHQSEDGSSEDEDIVDVAITNHEIPLSPPSMCLMAKGNSKVSDAKSGENDDEFDPNKFSNLIYEYTCIIKREKCNVKNLRVHISHLSHLTMTCLQSTMHCSRSMMSHLYFPRKLVTNMTNSSLSMWI
jgi:hypothetical protein